MGTVALLQDGLAKTRRAARRWRPTVTVETLVLLASAYFVLTANARLWQVAIPEGWAQWRLATALVVLVFASSGLLLGILLVGRWAKPGLALLLIATALASHYMQSYGVYLDEEMLRNVLHTDWAESRELLTPGLGLHLVTYAGLPCVLLWKVGLVRRPVSQRLLRRGALLLSLWAVAMLAMAMSFQDLSSLVRNQREARYLVTPANYLYGLAHLAFSGSGKGERSLQPVAPDARQWPVASSRRPRLVVLVVGETVRAQNWGLNGYARQTTPELARLPVTNFPNVEACGSSTEVSLPCMFSPFGRPDRGGGKVRNHESLLHVLKRAGVDVLWRDNQSGCKGVCAGLAFESVAASGDSRLCNNQRCLDAVLLEGGLAGGGTEGGDRLVVLHMLGNHGPSYFQRYPARFERFRPSCGTAELGRCTREQVVNAYDNAVLYTDHLLAQAIAGLGDVDGYDTALLYVSDHGESLGENGLYLHGMPRLIAPREQLQVPMLMWFSPGFTASAGLDLACLQNRATLPASHENLFHTVLGLFDVETCARVVDRDLLAGCRGGG